MSQHDHHAHHHPAATGGGGDDTAQGLRETVIEPDAVGDPHAHHASAQDSTHHEHGGGNEGMQQGGHGGHAGHGADHVARAEVVLTQ